MALNTLIIPKLSPYYIIGFDTFIPQILPTAHEHWIQGSTGRPLRARHTEKNVEE